MGDNKTNWATGPGVIAVTQEESKFRAVKLVKREGAFEVLWTKSGAAGQSKLGEFATECCLSAGLGGHREADKDKIAVAGFDSSGVVFYRVRVPAVKDEEVAAMVRLQAESRLPLPPEHMELVWRKGRVQDGQVGVTIAAARREQLQGFVEAVRGSEPAKILLDCEGMVKAWRVFFSGSDEPAVVVSTGEQNTKVCMAECGRLVNAVSLDVGTEDFSSRSSAKQTATGERFAQDMRSVLELFGCADPTVAPVFVLSDGSSVMKRIVSCLQSAGLNVEAALPEVRNLKSRMDLAVEDIYEYRVPIGLASIALDGDVEELNIFERLYRPVEEKVKKHWYYSLKLTSAIVAGMAVLLIVVLCAADVASNKRLSRLETEADFRQLIQRQTLIKAVARQRPDLLVLLREISSAESGGIMLDNFHFEKGQPVRISGQAPGYDQLFKFQENLMTKKGIKDVKIENQTRDKKGKKLNFTLEFHYGSFTRKSGGVRI